MVREAELYRLHNNGQNGSGTLQQGQKLLGLAFLTMEMAESAVAKRDLEASQLLVELAMSVLFTAANLAPNSPQAIEQARQQLDRLARSVRVARPTDEDANDPDSTWPYPAI